MNEILYLTENRVVKSIEFEFGVGGGPDVGVTFREKAFIIAVIWNGTVLTSRLEGLTALEKYAMNSNGFDYMMLTDGDFRLENSMFLRPNNWAVTAMPANGNPIPVSEPPTGGVSPLFPIYHNNLDWNKVIHLTFTHATNLFNATSGHYNLDAYIYNTQFENTTTQVFGCLYFLSVAKMPENVTVYIEPKTGEFFFHDRSQWTELHEPQFTRWSVNKGYIRAFRHTEGNIIFISTTPIDNSIAFALPT